MAPKPIVQHSQIEPPEGWKQHSEEHGFMGFDSTPAGRLVRLADVVAWLETEKALPRLNAVEALCYGLTVNALVGLYEVRLGHFAVSKPVDCTYGYPTPAQVEAAEKHQRGKAAAMRHGGGMWSEPNASRPKKSQPRPAQLPTEPGLPALVRRIRESWGVTAGVRTGAAVVLDTTSNDLSALAITVNIAHSLWGWGSVAEVVQLHVVSAEAVEPSTYNELVLFRASQSKSEWTKVQKGLAAKEASRRKALPGAKGVASAMAKELGVSVSRFNDLIRNSGATGKRETVRAKSA
jgi:hypothetical protein